MFDLAALARAAAVTVACLVMGASAAVGGVEVHRSSLLGYEVAGQVWEEGDAARALAYEAGKAAVAAQPMLPGLDAASPVVTARLHPDLLRAPVESLGAWAEIWFAGDAANRRIAALKRALGRHNVTEAKMPRQGLTVEDARTRIRYTVPAGASVPAIEVAS